LAGLVRPGGLLPPARRPARRAATAQAPAGVRLTRTARRGAGFELVSALLLGPGALVAVHATTLQPHRPFAVKLALAHRSAEAFRARPRASRLAPRASRLAPRGGYASVLQVYATAIRSAPRSLSCRASPRGSGNARGGLPDRARRRSAPRPSAKRLAAAGGAHANVVQVYATALAPGTRCLVIGMQRWQSSLNAGLRPGGSNNGPTPDALQGRRLRSTSPVGRRGVHTANVLHRRRLGINTAECEACVPDDPTLASRTVALARCGRRPRLACWATWRMRQVADPGAAWSSTVAAADLYALVRV
jgi:hypothetical protein